MRLTFPVSPVSPVFAVFAVYAVFAVFPAYAHAAIISVLYCIRNGTLPHCIGRHVRHVGT